MATAILDRYEISINGQTYDGQLVEPQITIAPEDLSRTFSCRLPSIEQFLEAGNDVSVGAEIIVSARRSGDPGSPSYKIMRGSIIDKIVPEDRGISIMDINCVDDTYRLTRTGVKFSVNSPTFTQEVYLFFKSDGSGAGSPTEYVRKAELRVKSGSDFYIPFEDMDNIPLHSMRRKKTDKRSVYLHGGEYKTQYLKKEVVFNAVQVLDTDPTKALPNRYVAGTPDPPSATNEDWEYRSVASFFRNPDYPTRNTSENTIERILRNIVLRGDPGSEEGGAGFPDAKLQFDLPYSKGATVTIKDRLNEGMRVTSHTLGASTITVSDGPAWTGKTSLYYYDTQGVKQTRTITLLAGNVITVSAAFTNMVVGMRVYGCDQRGCLLTLTSGSTADMVNYTDIEIASTSYFIREIRSATTLVVVNADESGSFAGLGASGDLTYFTIEYTGLQVNRLNWDKQKGSIADFLQFCLDKAILPVNYRTYDDPQSNYMRGRIIKQWRATVVSATFNAGPVTTDIVVDDVDGFYPGQPLCAKISGSWVQFSVTAVAPTTETVTVSGNASALTAGQTIYANCRVIYRHQGGEHSLSVEDMFFRAECFATANMSFPVLNSSTTGVLEAAPTDPTLVGSWSIIGGGLAAMVDDNPNTMFLLRWIATASDALEGDPTQWGMEPLPWCVASRDMGTVEEYDHFVLQLGYRGDEDAPDEQKFFVKDNNLLELPLMTIEGSVEDTPTPTSWGPVSSECVARQFNPQSPNGGQLNFKCDLIKNFRHIRICVDRPFFYKQGESPLFGTPTRCRDVPILTFQLYKRPLIRYTEADETVSRDQGSPNDQITPYTDKIPFVQITDKGATISAIAGAGPFVLTVPAGHNILAADLVEFWDTSANVPFAGTSSQVGVISVTATSITVPTVPAGLAATDKIGGYRRWILDALGEWRDFHMPETVARFFRKVKPLLIVEDESAQNGWDAQQIAAVRLWENLLSVRDATGAALWDPTVPLYSQVVNSNLFNPELVMGLAFNSFYQSLQCRNYNDSIETIATGGA